MELIIGGMIRSEGISSYLDRDGIFGRYQERLKGTLNRMPYLITDLFPKA
jgi:hypothetical protein